ncbi:NifA, Fis Family transcriptional regulator [Candidatus Magnetoovum chiemensis]|nr:NifA, Fis Family transcriptional regulator [Candidatus Magnetoovum chiemensis]
MLQEREFERIGSERSIRVDLRVIVATSKNLEELVSDNKFREDLYYRLNVVPIILPPLRERLEDIFLLIDHFLRKFNKEHNRNVSISNEAMEVMISYHWPGNVRELLNIIERLVIMSPSSIIAKKYLPERLHIPLQKQNIEKNTPLSLIQAEKTKVMEALEACDWVHSRAAKLLGITQRQIGYKVKKYGLRRNVS